MQIVNLSAIVFAIASVANVAVAKSCVNGGVYCGQSLLNRGNYRDHITQVLRENNQPTDNAHIVQSLFRCVSGGEIIFQQYCAWGCGGVGSQEADYCF